jgi:large subunit ribosomal protein L22
MNQQLVKTQVARLRYLRMAPRKVRAVGNLLRGLSVNEAEAQLMFQSRRASKPLLKLLRSAKANAVTNARLDPAKLYVQTIFVDQGPMLKRMLPRARGSASPIQRKMSHVTLVLAESLQQKPSRFTIAPRKKAKKAPEETRKEKKVPERKGLDAAPRTSQGGFFKRVFRRKSV